MYLSEQDFTNQASACLAGFVDPVFLHNVFSIVHNLPTPEFDGMVNAHRAFLDFLDLWDKRDKVERGGAEVLFKLSRNVITGMCMHGRMGVSICGDVIGECVDR